MEDWAKENAPIMVDFARDHGAMPDWAHAEFREAGVPEYVQVVWKRERPEDPASPADWAYDPPGPWAVIGDEPPWSSRPMDEAYNPNAGAGKAPAAAIPEGFVVQNMAWLGDKLALPVTDIVYPPHKDELLAMVESKDPTRGGWVTMSVLEAMGSGADYTEAVRDAAAVHFVRPVVLRHPGSREGGGSSSIFASPTAARSARTISIIEMIVPPQTGSGAAPENHWPGDRGEPAFQVRRGCHLSRGCERRSHCQRRDDPFDGGEPGERGRPTVEEIRASGASTLSTMS